MRSKLMLAAVAAGLFAFNIFAPTASAQLPGAYGWYGQGYSPYYSAYSATYAVHGYGYGAYSYAYRPYYAGYVAPYGYTPYYGGYSAGYDVRLWLRGPLRLRFVFLRLSTSSWQRLLLRSVVRVSNNFFGRTASSGPLHWRLRAGESLDVTPERASVVPVIRRA